MWPFTKSDDSEKVIKGLTQERDMLVRALSDTTAKNEAVNGETRKLLVSIMGRLSASERDTGILRTQGDVIHARPGGSSGGGSAAAFTIRYRNDTATSNEADIHRLEWIAQPTAIDTANYPNYTATGDYAADHPYMWADELWTPVVGGEAVEYIPAG